MKSVLIADDHPLTLWGMNKVIEGFGYRIVSSDNNGISAYNHIISRQPDIALLDINLPGMSGFEVLEKIKLKKSRTRVVFCTMHNEISVFNRAKELGANGYILKAFEFEELEECLSRVSNDECFFSAKLNVSLILDYSEYQKEQNNGLAKLSVTELKVLKLVALQLTSKKIATELFVSEKTIEAHRTHIMRKLNLPKEKNTLLMWAIKNINSL